jgi:hypothetical protein
VDNARLRSKRGTDLNLKDYVGEKKDPFDNKGKTKLSRLQHLQALARQSELDKAKRDSENKSNAFNDIMGDDNSQRLQELSQVASLLDLLD